MLNQEEILKLYKLAVTSEYARGYGIAYQVIHQKLPKGIKQMLKEAFPRPPSLGYQNPIALLEVAKYIITEAVDFHKKENNFASIVLPGFFDNIHHDSNGCLTSIIIGIIKSQIPKFDWQANVNWFDGIIYVKGRKRAYIEAGWILPHKVRDLVYSKGIEQLWLFPYEVEADVLAPYYFTVMKGPNCSKTIEEDEALLRYQLEQVQKYRGIWK